MKIVASLLFLLLGSVCFAAPAATEIEALLNYVGGLDGATFIRNGSAHSAREAESHLRLKWEKQAKKVATAEDFIVLCGSKSSMSGERYRIRFKDGSERFCDEVLTEQLAALRKKTGQTSDYR